MKFSKEKFLKNAPTGIKRPMSDSELDDLDGKEVMFRKKERDGYVERTMKDGMKVLLHPIYKSRCVK